MTEMKKRINKTSMIGNLFFRKVCKMYPNLVSESMVLVLLHFVGCGEIACVRKC